MKIYKLKYLDDIKGVNFFELMMALTIFGILIALASTSYNAWVKKAKAREAVSMIMLLYEGAYRYRSKHGFFKSCSDITACVNDYNIGKNMDSYAKNFSYAIKQNGITWEIVATTKADSAFPENKELKFYLTGSKKGKWDGDPEILQYR